jgi:hypothetical protein
MPSFRHFPLSKSGSCQRLARLRQQGREAALALNSANQPEIKISGKPHPLSALIQAIAGRLTTEWDRMKVPAASDLVTFFIYQARDLRHRPWRLLTHFGDWSPPCAQCGLGEVES